MISVVNSFSRTVWVFRQLAADRTSQDSRDIRNHLRRCSRFLWICIAVLLVSMLLLHPAESGAQIFDGIVNNADRESARWFDRIVELVRPTFMLLATIEICWAAAIWAFERDNLSSLSVEIIKKIMFIGFFFMLLTKAPEWIPTITGTFATVGEEAAGIERGSITTDGIINAGLGVIGKLWAATLPLATAMMAAPHMILGTSVPGVDAIARIGEAQVHLAAIASIIIGVAFVVAAAQFFCLKVESALLFAAGAIFLGMGSSSWTKEYVTKYLNYAINVGVRLLVLILVLSLTLRQVSSIGVVPAIDPVALMRVVGAAVLQAILAMKVPELAGALLSGGAGFTAGSALSGGGNIVSSVASTAMAAKAVANLGQAAVAARMGQNKAGGNAGPGASNLGGLGHAARGSMNPMGGPGAAGGGQAGREPPRGLSEGMRSSGRSGNGSHSSSSSAASAGGSRHGTAGSSTAAPGRGAQSHEGAPRADASRSGEKSDDSSGSSSVSRAARSGSQHDAGRQNEGNHPESAGAAHSGSHSEATSLSPAHTGSGGSKGSAADAKSEGKEQTSEPHRPSPSLTLQGSAASPSASSANRGPPSPTQAGRSPPLKKATSTPDSPSRPKNSPN